MNIDSVFLEGAIHKVISVNTLIVGGGASGLSAAIDLFDHGQRDLLLVSTGVSPSSEQICSDAQPYYRLASFRSESDSPLRMARSLTGCGSADADVLYLQAAYSSRSFYRLTFMGIPFPQDEYGEFSSTGTEEEKRSISCGLDTGARIVRSLRQQIRQRAVTCWENYRLVRIFTNQDRTQAVGALLLNLRQLEEPHLRFTFVKCTNLVLASGGPAGVFASELYAPGQYGALAMAAQAGARLQNLTDFLRGICAVKVPLMMNRSFQQAAAKYVSTDAKGGDPKEFLPEYLKDPQLAAALQQQKARQWALDAKKVRTDGSSLLDVLVFHETQDLHRHVFMDFRSNPAGREENTRPWERLRKLCSDGYEYLSSHGLDPREHAIEVKVQVCGLYGGISVNTRYESSVSHLFAIGEAAGDLCSGSPSGAMLAAGQVSAYRASQVISSEYSQPPIGLEEYIACIREEAAELIRKTS